LIKAKAHIQVWRPGISLELNLLKWKFLYSVYKNQHAKWISFHFGPISISFTWDLDLLN